MGSNNPDIKYNQNPLNGNVEEGISLFTAVKNRREMLEKSLQTWVLQEQIDEIIIVDWASDESLVPLIEQYQDGRIFLAVVQNQPKWILSHAYNLAARLTTKSMLLKMDADVKILPGFFDQHQLTQGRFYTGNWKIARNDNEKHLHGISFMFREDFFRVNGYNEFIKTYGWDDIDLYDRLESASLLRNDLNNDTLLHIEHARRTSFQNQMDFLNTTDDKEKALLNSLVNRFLTASFRPWTTKESMLSFDIRTENKFVIKCVQDKDDINLVPEEIIRQCETQAIVERFYELGVPFDKNLLIELSRNELVDLLNLYYTRTSAASLCNYFNILLAFNKKYGDSLRENEGLKKESQARAQMIRDKENVLRTKETEFRKINRELNLLKEQQNAPAVRLFDLVIKKEIKRKIIRKNERNF